MASVFFRYDAPAMKISAPLRLLAGVATMLALPALAHAHSQSALVYDCAAGLAHPWHGWDHLAAMLAVGVWAAQLGGRARWLLPAMFVSVMACAAALGARGFTPSGLEPLLATSVLVLGLVIAAALRPSLGTGVALVAFFAAGHGFAHGAEIPAAAQAAPYAAGFILATAALHLGGLVAGLLALRISALLPRALGAACAATGFLLLLS